MGAVKGPEQAASPSSGDWSLTANPRRHTVRLIPRYQAGFRIAWPNRLASCFPQLRHGGSKHRSKVFCSGWPRGRWRGGTIAQQRHASPAPRRPSSGWQCKFYAKTPPKRGGLPPPELTPKQRATCDAIAPGAIASVRMGARSSSDQRRRRSPRVTTSTTDRRLLEGVLFRALSVTLSSTTYASASLQRRKWHDQWELAQGGAQAAVTPHHRPRTYERP